jgi:RNA polymerase sigma-70 factor (ECF subfamily)
MNPTELEAQLERLHRESYGWALHCCDRNEAEAEDVLQTTYLRVVSGKARFKEKSSFRTWLFGVIRRTAREHGRRDRARRERILRLVPANMEDSTVPDPIQQMENTRRSRALLAALEKLSDRQREVLHLVFYQDLSIAEAAEVMGVSLGSARTHYERGKSRLRTLLQDSGHDESSTGS